MEIESSKGIGSKELKELKGVMEQEAKLRVNNVMCMDIVQAIQSFLEDRRRINETFYDAMVRREKEKESFVASLKDTAKVTAPSNATLGTTSLNNNVSNITKNKATISVQSNQQIPAVKHFKAQVISPAKSEMKVGTTKLESKVGNVDGIKSTGKNDKKLITTSVIVDNNKKIEEKEEEDNFHDLYEPLDGGDENDDDEDDEEVNVSNENLTGSRFANEFTVKSQLGFGASGIVWRVRNKLDRRIYAVKKIHLKDDKSLLTAKIQREVTTISRLLHKNIVRYYAAWMEESAAEEMNDANSASTSLLNTNESYLTKPTALNNTKAALPMYGSEFIKDVERDLWEVKKSKPGVRDFEILFDDGDSQGAAISNRYQDQWSDDSDSESGSDSDSDSDDGSSSGSSSNDSSDSDSESNSRSGSESSDSKSVSRKRNFPVSKNLYIQMEFCNFTLRAIIDYGRLWSRKKEIMRILREILEALSYMHKKKVIHRDLKVRTC